MTFTCPRCGHQQRTTKAPSKGWVCRECRRELYEYGNPFAERVMNDLEERRMEEWFDGEQSNLRESRIEKARADLYVIKGVRL